MHRSRFYFDPLLSLDGHIDSLLRNLLLLRQHVLGSTMTMDAEDESDGNVHSVDSDDESCSSMPELIAYDSGNESCYSMPDVIEVN